MRDLWPVAGGIRRWGCLAAIALATALGPTEAVAQAHGPGWLPPGEARMQRQYFAVNALLGGAVAGTAALFRRDPFFPAFARGAAGGAIAFGGKRTAVSGGPGAGLLGRQVTSIGSSITGNAVAGRGSFDRIAFSVGPVRAYVGTEVDGVSWRVDVPAVLAAAWTAREGGRIDVRESLSMGTLVFEGDRNYGLPGTMSYRRVRSEAEMDERLAHEQVHVLQFDQSFLSLGAPLEDWMAERFNRLGWPFRYIEFNLPVLAGVAALACCVWEYPDSWWEREAFLLGHIGAYR